MCDEPIAMLAEPERDVCETCGKETELKDYAPHSSICLACALVQKAQGHRWALRRRNFEPS